MITTLLVWDLEKLKHLMFRKFKHLIFVTVSVPVLDDSEVYSSGGWVTTNTKILTE